MKNDSAVLRFAILILAICLDLIWTGCQGALTPEQTPERTVINFLKAVGRGDFSRADSFVVPEKRGGQAQLWANQLFFPDHATPPSKSDEEQIDHFIGLFYRLTATTTPAPTDTQVEVRLTFSGTDAMVGFPSVANDPLVPNTALFMVTLTRTLPQPESKEKPGDWMISDMVPSIESH
jgi:hypothetical protein